MSARRPVASLALALAALAPVALAPAAPARAAAQVTIDETGSSLLYPLFGIWAKQYAKLDPGTHVDPHSTGSGNGIAQAMSGSVAIGASDAFMTDAQMQQDPAIVDVPLAISAQTVNYNLPGLGSRVRLDGPTLAGIYSGNVRSWDAPQIANLNPGVPLPHRDIVPVHRSDGSGDTFVFSQFLSFSTPDWDAHHQAGTSIDWPAVPGGLGAVGNAGMVATLGRTPYAVGYVGISYFKQIAAAKLGTAPLKNAAGDFVLPTTKTVTAAASVLTPRTPPDERLSLVFAQGADSYPLVNYEYAIVSTKQPDPAKASAIREFLLWTIATCQGNSEENLDAVHFIALPNSIRALSEAQLEKIR